MNQLQIIQSPSFQIVSLILILTLCFAWRNSPPVGEDRQFIEAARSHSDTHTLGTTPLDEWSVHRRDLNLTTHNIHNRKTSIPTAGFEPAIPAGKRPLTHALHRASTGIGLFLILPSQIRMVFTVATTLHVSRLQFYIHFTYISHLCHSRTKGSCHRPGFNYQTDSDIRYT